MISPDSISPKLLVIEINKYRTQNFFLRKISLFMINRSSWPKENSESLIFISDISNSDKKKNLNSDVVFWNKYVRLGFKKGS